MKKSTSLLLTGMKEPAYTLGAMISDATMPNTVGLAEKGKSKKKNTEFRMD